MSSPDLYGVYADTEQSTLHITEDGAQNEPECLKTIWKTKLDTTTPKICFRVLESSRESSLMVHKESKR